MEQIAKDLKLALLAADKFPARSILEQSSHKYSSVQVIEKLVVPVLESIGEGWIKGEYALSQVYMSGKIIEELTDSILPKSDFKRENQPRMAITVLEDYHMLGKRVVYSVLRSSGFELLDTGRKSNNMFRITPKRSSLTVSVVNVLNCFIRDLI